MPVAGSRRTTLGRVVVGVLLALLAATWSGGCADDENASRPDTNARHTPASLSAREVARRLTLVIPQMRVTVVYTRATDPNRLLGRAEGYLSKIAFTDTRVPTKAASGTRRGAIARGGSVEVFTDASGALARSKYIQESIAATPILGAEYNYLRDGVLVRVTGTLPAMVGSEYERALAGPLAETAVGAGRSPGVHRSFA